MRRSTAIAAAIIAASILTGTARAAPVRHSCPPASPGTWTCFAEVLVASVTPRAAALKPQGYGPADLRSAYDFAAAANANGTGQTVAIVDAYDDPSAEADLAVYRSQYGLPACATANGCFEKVNQHADAGPLPPPNHGWAEEISLDLDMVSASCPKCHILLVETKTPSAANLAKGVDRAVALGADVVSNSYGGPEKGRDLDIQPHYDHAGVAIVASSGDAGYSGDGAPADSPAAYPTVTAVGGTSLRPAGNARGWSEQAWTDGGSGCSQIFAQPAFQAPVATGCAGRAVSDVAAVGDPQTGVAVYDTFRDPGWQVFGGTSASAPLIAGIYALQADADSVDPQANIYAHAADLYDVTTQSNGFCHKPVRCHAGVGYDEPTGLGTPNGIGAF